MGVFNNKTFNSEVFAKYLETVPRVKQNAFLKAGVLRTRNDIKNLFSEQVGGNFATVPMTGRIGGEALNYNGSTNITATGLETFTQSMIVVGRSKAWTEKDFSYDLTKKDFMADIAAQSGEYWDDVDQATILSTLKGIFGVQTNSFNTSHTLDITSDNTATVGATTLNSAIQKAAGANKNLFKVVIMHSVVATNLENLQVLSYWKETDANGVQRDVALASWNGRTVLIDDDVPTTEVEESSSGAGDGYTAYTTYILGADAFDYVDCGAKVPVETYRDPKTNGGEDTLIMRQRKIFAPRGFSFVQPNNSAIISPTAENLETAARWTIVKDSAGSGYYPSKAIPFARIISKG